MGTIRDRAGPAQGDGNGFTLVEVAVVVGLIGILVAIGLPLYANTQARARIAKGQADARVLASAVATYQAHTGSLPPDLNALTVTAANEQGQTAGPFMAAIPSTPEGWSSSSGPAAQAIAHAKGKVSASSASGYGYATATTGAFTVSAAGDGVTVSAP